MGTEEVLTNADLEQMKGSNNEKVKKYPSENPQDASEEFISVPKTSSFRASLRKRNAMLTSDSSDSDERDASLDEVPVYQLRRKVINFKSIQKILHKPHCGKQMSCLQVQVMTKPSGNRVWFVGLLPCLFGFQPFMNRLLQV